MANFDTQIKQSQAQVAEAQAKISRITGQIEAAQSKLATPDAVVDIETATLEDVHKHTDLMNANIAELIMGLDDVTAGFSKDFSEMRTKTGTERNGSSASFLQRNLNRCGKSGCAGPRLMQNCRI